MKPEPRKAPSVGRTRRPRPLPGEASEDAGLELGGELQSELELESGRPARGLETRDWMRCPAGGAEKERSLLQPVLHPRILHSKVSRQKQIAELSNEGKAFLFKFELPNNE